MSTKYLIERDISGTTNGTGFGMPFAQDGESALLAATVEQHIVVPSNYPCWIAVITCSYGATVFVNGITTAVVPAGAFSASSAEIVPPGGMARFVIAGQTLSFITADVAGAKVTVKYLIGNRYQNSAR